MVVPRSATKSHTAKSKRVSSVLVTPPMENEHDNHVIGLFNQPQCVNILIQEEGDEVVGEIVDALLDKVLEGCLSVYIKRQLIPFTASWAKSYLTQTLERQIMCPDEGEVPEEATTTEDSEPMPATYDAFAQGCVPVVHVAPQCDTADAQQADDVEDPAQTEPRDNQQCNDMAQTYESPMQSDKETSPRRPVGENHCKELLKGPQTKMNQKKKTVYLPPISSQGKAMPNLHCSSEKQDVKVKDKNGKCSVNLLIRNHKSVPLHQPRKHRPIPRLDPLCLPQHCIFPQYDIFDNDYSKSNLKKSIGIFKRTPKYKQTELTVAALTPSTSSKDQPAKVQRGNEEDALSKKWSPSVHSPEGMELSAYLKLDTMVLAEGVSLWDPESVESDPLKFDPPSQSTKLMPIRTNKAGPLDLVIQDDPLRDERGGVQECTCSKRPQGEAKYAAAAEDCTNMLPQLYSAI